MERLRLALCQMNATVGDLAGNTAKVLAGMERAREVDAHVVVFPELAVTGYPPEDLLLKPAFISENLECLEEIANASSGLSALVGFVNRQDDIFNAAAVLFDGKLAAVYHKSYLPNYGVFDENRYFQAGAEPFVVALNGATLGPSICEDIWYPGGPVSLQSTIGNAEILVNISASPYSAGKAAYRQRMLATRAADNLCVVAYVNLVGGQDELVFDGRSLVLDQEGEVLAAGKQFEEDFLVVDVDVEAVFRHRLHDPRRRREKQRLAEQGMALSCFDLGTLPTKVRPGITPSAPEPLPFLAEVHQALVLGTRDYVRKNGFRKVVIGLSGGIDSSLTATIAADALGPENVVGVVMPSQHSSAESKEDALELARNLGIEVRAIPIQSVCDSFLAALREEFAGTQPDVTEENIQARARGTLLMALSNKFGWLVLTTGNKSEASTGYATLYGDMAGGLSVIKDVPKTLVYQLARFYNEKTGCSLIPERVLSKPPSAELRPNQKDSDTLPEYEDLDPILTAYVEEDRSFKQIVEAGLPPDRVKDVIRMVDRSEYKRRQAPPGIKISPRAFGKDRRLPITNAYVEG